MTNSLAGGFDVGLTLNGNSYLWELFGGNQLFTGPTSNPGLLTGPFSYGGTAFGLNDSLGDIVSGPGTIVASAPTAVPEPSSLTLLGTGIVVITGAIRRKLLSGIRA
jgi:hypothetical protein